MIESLIARAMLGLGDTPHTLSSEPHSRTELESFERRRLRFAAESFVRYDRAHGWCAAQPAAR